MPKSSTYHLGPTTFTLSPRKISLASLLGLPGDPSYSSPETSGLITLCSTLAPQGHAFSLRRATRLKNALRLSLSCPEGLELISDWEHDPATAVLRRRDKVINRSSRPLTLLRALPRFTLARGSYEAYSQSSAWGAESQGSWRDLGQGLGLEWGSERGRLCQPAAPYLCVRPKGGKSGLALHVITRGNWAIRLRSTDASFWPGGPHAVIEAGLADRHLALKLMPGATLELPELLLQPLPEGQPHLAAPALHKHLLARDLGLQPRKPPLLYNSWFDRYDDLDPARLRAQARRAKALGCEVFTVDAGWFGRAGLRWDLQVGHWGEKPDAAFRGRMLDFAREIRAMGMGFGLWMEPERIARLAPLVKEHPEWLIESAPGAEYRLDLENPKARAWIKAEVSRVIKTYGVVWLKVDSNFAPGPDSRGGELSGYFASWWGLLDEWRAEHPGCFFEGCSSGAMRLELSALKHHDAHFLSDKVNPYSMLSFLQGTALRVPPSRLTLWSVLRGDGKGGVVAPQVHSLWEPVAVDPAFLAALCLPGIFTLSGDLLTLPAQAQATLRRFASFWKARREFLTGSACHLLTPPTLQGEAKGWAALELEELKGPRRVLLAFRCDDAASSRVFKPVALAPKRRYRVCDEAGVQLAVRSGSDLMRRGLRVSLPKRFSARVLELS